MFQYIKILFDIINKSQFVGIFKKPEKYVIYTSTYIIDGFLLFGSGGIDYTPLKN